MIDPVEAEKLDKLAAELDRTQPIERVGEGPAAPPEDAEAPRQTALPLEP